MNREISVSSTSTRDYIPSTLTCLSPTSPSATTCISTATLSHLTGKTASAHLPLLPDMPNFILGPGHRTTPRLTQPQMYSQLDECDRNCRHPRWPTHLVIAVLDRDTCRGCIFKFPHYYLEKCDGRHQYFHLSAQEQALSLIIPDFAAPMPSLPSDDRIGMPPLTHTYANRLSSASSSSTTAALPRTLNTRMTTAYTNTPVNPAASATAPVPVPSASPGHIKTKRLNMICRSVPLNAPLPSLPAPFFLYFIFNFG